VSQARTNESGLLRVDENGCLPIHKDGIISIGDQMNSWAGITVLQVSASIPDGHVQHTRMYLELHAHLHTVLSSAGVIDAATLPVQQ
jgi:hypothetical protein